MLGPNIGTSPNAFWQEELLRRGPAATMNYFGPYAGGHVPQARSLSSGAIPMTPPGQPETYQMMGRGGENTPNSTDGQHINGGSEQPEPGKRNGGGLLNLGSNGMFGGMGFGSFGSPNYAMTMAGLGMLSGRNNAEAMQGAMRGFVGGASLDKSNKEDARKLAKEERLRGLAGAALQDKNISPEMRALAAEFPEYALKIGLPQAKDPTTLMQNLQAAGLQPGTPEYRDAMLKASMPASTNVNVGSEKGFDKTVGEGYGKVFMEGLASGSKARSTLGSLSAMEKAMEDPNFFSGGGANMNLPIKRAIVALGGDPKAAASMESFQALSQRAALDTMGGSLGTGFSNADRDFVVNQVPNLGNTPEGNKQLIKTIRAIEERKIAIAQRMRDYAKRNGGRIDAGFDEELSDWAENNPLFPDAAPTVQSPSQDEILRELKRRGIQIK